MSLHELFRNASLLESFENKARSEGFNQFQKRGSYYCVSDLNLFAAGFMVGVNMEPLKIEGEPTEEQRAAFAVDAGRFKVEAAA